MQQPLSDDLMIGVEAIAQFTGQSERRIFHMLASGQPPRLQAGQQMGSEKVNPAAAHR
jgi:hypothetical protein